MRFSALPPRLCASAVTQSHVAGDMVKVVTKIQTRFRLQRPLGDASLNSLAAAHAIYGIYKLKLSPALDELFVEYDATRLRPAEVESALAAAGIPIVG